MKEGTILNITLFALILGFVCTYYSISSDYEYFKFRIDGLEKANSTLIRRLNKIPETTLKPD